MSASMPSVATKTAGKAAATNLQKQKSRSVAVELNKAPLASAGLRKPSTVGDQATKKPASGAPGATKTTVAQDQKKPTSGAPAAAVQQKPTSGAPAANVKPKPLGTQQTSSVSSTTASRWVLVGQYLMLVNLKYVCCCEQTNDVNKGYVKKLNKEEAVLAAPTSIAVQHIHLSICQHVYVPYDSFQLGSSYSATNISSCFRSFSHDWIQKWIKIASINPHLQGYPSRQPAMPPEPSRSRA
jgi:hypothetical protein